MLLKTYLCLQCFNIGDCPNKHNYFYEWKRLKAALYLWNDTATECSCLAQCERDAICNGFSFDDDINMCYLISCNISSESYWFNFYKKKNSGSPLSFVPVTTMSDIISSESVPSMREQMTIKQTISVEQQTTIEQIAPDEQQMTMEQTTPVEQQTTIKQTAAEEQQTTVEQTNSEKHSTTKEQTTSVNQYTTEKKSTTIGPSTTLKLSTSKEQRTTLTWPTKLTSSSNTLTINDTTQKTKNSTLCACVCKHTNQTIQESIEKRRRELILNKTELSFNKRKRTSAGDNRKTSSAMGTVGVIILVLYGLLFFFADIWTFFVICHSNMFHKNNKVKPNV